MSYMKQLTTKLNLTAILSMIGESDDGLDKQLATDKRVTKHNDDRDHIDELHLEIKPQN